jgi:hypothetical protein
MKSFLQQQRRPGEKMNLTFEIRGQAGYMYDSLLNSVDGITVTRPRCHLEPRACVIAADLYSVWKPALCRGSSHVLDIRYTALDLM